MEFLSQRPLFSDDPSTKGFDLSSGKIWIYPENYPVREYQFEIVKAALYQNTLVCLPTGLGKTFIAAVVMYNFWRWYPQGKIVFMAPTKPLVAQQINACHEIMGIPGQETVELTGATIQKKREIAWAEHRIIFATPQVFHKDLEKDIVPVDRIKCVIIDEAHKALGKHSYCESIRLLTEKNQYFRILALSATPGSKLDAVQEVVRNLHIAHLELRDDASPDIIPYINERKLDIVLVGLGADLEKFKERYIIIMDRHVRLLIENNVLHGSAGNISKGRIFHLTKEWQQKTNRSRNHGLITKTLNILMTMYHAYELMVRHGLRAFYNFYQNHMDKYWLNDENDLHMLLEEINYFLGPFPEVRTMPDGSVPEIPDDIRFGHNKFQKLKECLLRHFESFEDKEEETRAIVFVEYRDIVDEVYVLLLQSRPLLRPQKFVGQAGQKQKQQKQALENFRRNKVNVLISTSVGEEGLDVGEVDLIVCFDISQQSPIRLVQRMGRTGRKRDGNIVVLVTDGKEYQTLTSTMSRRDSLNNKVLHSSGIINALQQESPRMVPEEFHPECQKMVMTIIPKTSTTKGKKGKTKEIKETKAITNKQKNTKLPEPSNKAGGSQATLMRFFKPSEGPSQNPPTIDFTEDPLIKASTSQDPAVAVNDDIIAKKTKETSSQSAPSNQTKVTQVTQHFFKNNNKANKCNTIKASEVKLLSSDDAAVEFLTLCTLKNSEKAEAHIGKAESNPYLPSHYSKTDDNDNVFDFQVPDLRVLDCLRHIPDCVPPTKEIESDNEDIDDFSNGFNNPDIYFDTQRNRIAEESKFEALLDDTSSDTEIPVLHPEQEKENDYPVNENVDWGDDTVGFEHLLDQISNSPKAYDAIDNSKSDKINEKFCPTINEPLDEPGVFEDILNLTSDESETESNLQHANVGFKTSGEKINVLPAATADHELKRASLDIQDLSSDGYETDFSPGNVNVETKALENEKNSSKMKIDDESKGAFEDMLDTSDDETDFSLPMETDECHVSEKISKTNNYDALSNGAKNSSSICSGLTVSQTLREVERIHSAESVHSVNKINNDGPSDAEDECSKSPVFPDRPRSSRASCLDEPVVREPARQLIIPRGEDLIEENAESEEDIFGIEDLLVDSDFEAEVDDIDRKGNRDEEKSKQSKPVSQNVTQGKCQRKDCNLSADNTGEHSVLTNKVINSERNLEDNNQSEKVTKNPATSFATEFDLVDGQWTSEEAKSPSSPQETAYDVVDLTDCDQNIRNLQESTRLAVDDITLKEEIRLSFDEKCAIVDLTIADWDSNEAENPSVNLAGGFGVCNRSFKDGSEFSKAFVKESPLYTVDLTDCDLSSKFRTKPSTSDIWLNKSQSTSSIKESLALAEHLTDCNRSGKERSKSSTSFAKDSLPDTVDLEDCSWSSKEAIPSILPSSKKPDTSSSSSSGWIVRKRKRSSISSLNTVSSGLNRSTEERKKSSASSVRNSLADTVDLEEYSWSSKKSRRATLSLTTEPNVETSGSTHCYWNSPKTKFTSSTNKNEPAIVDLDDYDDKSAVKAPSLPASIKEPVADIVLDDCDWDSDFEIRTSPLNASASFQKSTERRETPKNNSSNGFRLKRTDENSGWLSTKKPKSTLSLGSKLARNVGSRLSSKQTREKVTPKSPDHDSDFENNFTVGRVETPLVKQVESDFFAKPDPVDKTSHRDSLNMSNYRRIVRKPLSVRRTDDNKMTVKSLSSFAAPTKYTQQQVRSKVVTSGRSKSASTDVEFRKKQKQRDDRRGNRIRSEFIDDEAEVSSDGNYSAGSSGTDDDLHGFVSYTQHPDDSVDMQAHYLQTVRSPPKVGGFHIRPPRNSSPVYDVYSQALPDETNAYLYDSFCVDEDEEVFEESESPQEISILDEIEMKLKNKKRKRVQSTDPRPNQKRRVITLTDTSSSEDEIEKMRHQIRDESFVLRNRCE